MQRCPGQVEILARGHEAARRLMTIPGIGPITATALIAAVGDARQFRKARDLAAWLGLVPRQSSTGGKTTLLGISKRGNPYVRRLLIHGARSCIVHLDRSRDRMGEWLDALDERMHLNKAIVALANKIALDRMGISTEAPKQPLPADRAGACLSITLVQLRGPRTDVETVDRRIVSPAKTSPSCSYHLLGTIRAHLIMAWLQPQLACERPDTFTQTASDSRTTIPCKAGADHTFFVRNSFSAAWSSIDSANSFFSLRFSSSSDRRRLASDTSMPPSDIACGRLSAKLGRRACACADENRIDILNWAFPPKFRGGLWGRHDSYHC